MGIIHLRATLQTSQWASNVGVQRLKDTKHGGNVGIFQVSVLVQATLALYGGYLLPYYLHEETGWSLSVDDLRSQTKKVCKDCLSLILHISMLSEGLCEAYAQHHQG